MNLKNTLSLNYNVLPCVSKLYTVCCGIVSAGLCNIAFNAIDDNVMLILCEMFQCCTYFHINMVRFRYVW